MTTTSAKLPCTAVVLLAGMVMASSAMAFQQKTVGAATPSGASPSHADQLEEAKNLTCLSGLEHMLPGIYYYCVGARDLARGKGPRGMGMLKIAARWGSKPAQFTMGVGYFNGGVVPRNRPLGLAWLGLATERHNPYIVATFKSAWDKALPQERRQAQVLWKSLLPEYGDKRAARRAELRYDHDRMELVRNAVYGATVCIAGLTTTRLGGSPDPTDPHACTGSTPVMAAAKVADHYADALLDDWRGHVSIGAVQEVSAPRK